MAHTYIFDPQLKRARALLMVAARVKGRSYKQIAAEFNVSEHTVQRQLDFAKRAGLIVDFEDQILQELVPAAISQIKSAIQNGDTQSAFEILKGAGLGLKPSERVAPKNAPLGGELPEGETLEVYIRRIREGHGPENALPPAEEAGDSASGDAAVTVIDVTPTETGDFEAIRQPDQPLAAQ